MILDVNKLQLFEFVLYFFVRNMIEGKNKLYIKNLIY